MARIHVLDKHTAELIAAGEVVERPASVVKELLENAIDAGATVITVEIKNGGSTYLSLTDNGCGIEPEDVPTAFLRHATSKVRTEADLDAIGTLGFRGEALASVAAVARVELITAVKNAAEGTHFCIEGGEITAQEAIGCPQGTTIVVRDLFYNVPARMKFLKKDVGEGNAVQGVVEKLAVSHPEIALRFVRDGREVLATPGKGNLKDCIYTVFGREFAGGLIPVEYELGGVAVKGFISKPSASRANRTMQHFYINGRYVKTRTAAAALEQAFKGSVMVGKFPTCVLFITLSPELVDANVHPAKIEVRFVNEKPVFDAVYHGVRYALEVGDSRRQTAAPVRPAPAKAEEPVLPVRPAAAVPQASPIPPVTVPEQTELPRSGRLSLHDSVRPERKPLFDRVPVTGSFERRADIAVEESPVPVSAPPVPEPETAPAGTAPAENGQTTLITPPEHAEVRYIGELFKTYILAEMNGSVYCIDKHAAHERILYNRLKTMEATEAQMLLSPETVTVSPEEFGVLTEAAAELEQTGFEVEEFGGTTLLVRAIPAILAGCDTAATLQEIARGLLDGRRDMQVEKRDWIYHSTACRAAIKAGDASHPEELKGLAQQVLWDDAVRYCPHGRPVCVEWTKKELEKQFGRL